MQIESLLNEIGAEVFAVGADDEVAAAAGDKPAAGPVHAEAVARSKPRVAVTLNALSVDDLGGIEQRCTHLQKSLRRDTVATAADRAQRLADGAGIADLGAARQLYGQNARFRHAVAVAQAIAEAVHQLQRFRADKAAAADAVHHLGAERLRTNLFEQDVPRCPRAEARQDALQPVGQAHRTAQLVELPLLLRRFNDLMRGHIPDGRDCKKVRNASVFAGKLDVFGIHRFQKNKGRAEENEPKQRGAQAENVVKRQECQNADAACEAVVFDLRAEADDLARLQELFANGRARVNDQL